MNLSKKLKYSVLLPIIAFMAVAIALCACIGIKCADVGTTAEAASHASHSGYTDLTTYDGDFLDGNYYLSADMTTSTFFKVQDSKSATVCLNGHTLTMSNSFDVAGTLTIEDCGSTGSVRFNSKEGFRDYGIGLASGFSSG